MKYKALVQAKYWYAVCLRVDLGGQYVYRIYLNVSEGNQIGEAESAAKAWKNAYNGMRK